MGLQMKLQILCSAYIQNSIANPPQLTQICVNTYPSPYIKLTPLFKKDVSLMTLR